MENLQQSELLVDKKTEDNEEDIIKQRREARKRKILENAKSRLEKLNLQKSGIGDNVVEQGSSGHFASRDCDYSDPEVEPDILHFPLQSNTNYNIYNNNDSSRTSDVILEENKPLQLTKFKIHIILSAVVAYAVFLFSYNSFAANASIFIPLGLAILTEFIYFPKLNNQNSLFNLLVLFGIRSDRVVKTLNIMFSVQSIISDVAIFIFCFCLISLLGNNYIDMIQIK